MMNNTSTQWWSKSNRWCKLQNRFINRCRWPMSALAQTTRVAAFLTTIVGPYLRLELITQRDVAKIIITLTSRKLIRNWQIKIIHISNSRLNHRRYVLISVLSNNTSNLSRINSSTITRKAALSPYLWTMDLVSVMYNRYSAVLSQPLTETRLETILPWTCSTVLFSQRETPTGSTSRLTKHMKTSSTPNKNRVDCLITKI